MSKYLTNKQLLKEIHKSKLSYCEFESTEYQDYDIIVEDLNEIFDASIQQQARVNKAQRIAKGDYDLAMEDYEDVKPKLSQFKIDENEIGVEDLVFRVHTFEHIPEDPGRKNNPKKESDHYVKLNFIPFKHYVIRNDKAVEVGRSHSRKGVFSQTHGSITDKLAHMFMLLVNRYSQRSNWRSYSYRDEMIGQSLLQLSMVGLQFNELRSDNPFSYYTQILQNSFRKVLNNEKKIQRAKDEVLIDQGQLPSHSRQIEHEEQVKHEREQLNDINDN